MKFAISLLLALISLNAAAALDSELTSANDTLLSVAEPAIGDDSMVLTRGGEFHLDIDVDSMVSKSTQLGQTNNNVAHNVTSGNNIISDAGLSGASGVLGVVQNSGSNVLIQNSTVINLKVDTPVRF